MKSGIFTIDIFKDLNYLGRVGLADTTKNPEILTILAEDSNQYVRGGVAKNMNTPIYILVKMLDEYDGRTGILRPKVIILGIIKRL